MAKAIGSIEFELGITVSTLIRRAINSVLLVPKYLIEAYCIHTLVEENLKYLRRCMVDCLKRGEAPYASHGLYTQEGVLDDTVSEERAKALPLVPSFARCVILS